MGHHDWRRQASARSRFRSSSANFGDGTIHGYNPTTARSWERSSTPAALRSRRPPLGIAFGNGARTSRSARCSFAAGIADEVTASTDASISARRRPTSWRDRRVDRTGCGQCHRHGGGLATARTTRAARKVEFFAGTTSLGVDTTCLNSVDWNTTASANGVFSLTAVAKDAARQHDDIGCSLGDGGECRAATGRHAPDGCADAPPAGNVSGTIAVSAMPRTNIGVTHSRSSSPVPLARRRHDGSYSVNGTPRPLRMAVRPDRGREGCGGHSTTSAAVNVTVGTFVPVTLAQLQTTISRRVVRAVTRRGRCAAGLDEPDE